MFFVILLPPKINPLKKKHSPKALFRPVSHPKQAGNAVHAFLELLGRLMLSADLQWIVYFNKLAE